MTSKKPTLSDGPESPVASPFVYRPAPGWTAPVDGPAGTIAVLARDSADSAAQAQPIEEEQQREREKQAWQSGFNEGLVKARSDVDREVQRQRDAISEALRKFAHLRDDYFRRVESEVVSLALAIARKVLRREAQIDPLLLSGLVRVALEKLSASRNVRMRVHPSQIAAWQQYFAKQHDLGTTVELSGDAILETNQCQIESETGNTELNLESQLKEIEQGLFDLLAQRPSAQ